MYTGSAIALITLLTFSGVAVAQKEIAKSSGTPSIQWINQPKEKDLPLPPGTQHLTFHSKLVNKDIGYCIYLPQGYAETPGVRYPVIYNLHGNGGTEFTSLDSIRVLDEGIAQGRWPKMIMVLPNGGHSTFYKNSSDGKFPIESILMQEFIPHIDATYQTVAEQHGRCIEGFSMGGRGATRLALKYPDIFCSLFCQAGNVPHLLDIYDSTEHAMRKQMLLGTDRSLWEQNDVYAVAEKNAHQIKKNVRIQIACGTKDKGHIQTIRDFHQHLLRLGIDHTYIELEGLGHQRHRMIDVLKPIWFDYHAESIKRAAPNSHPAASGS